MQRGRKSAESLTVVPFEPGHEWPEPPKELSAELAVEWRVIVRRMPPGWFTPEHFSMLCDLCGHIVTSRKLRTRIGKFPAGLLETEEGRRQYDLLLKMNEREVRSKSSLMTRLRLTPQSRYDGSNNIKAASAAKRVAAAANPWDLVS